MSGYDFAVLGFYLLFMIAVGLTFRRFSTTTSDYFRGGGTMLWWMTGAATVMGTISAWSFTGAASSVYQYGLIFITVWAVNLPVYLFVATVTAPRFRQMRVVTPVEAIRRRYGAFNEQFYAWIQVPREIFSGGLSLLTLAVFISAVFGQNVSVTILVVGVLVVLVALLGGAWAVAAGGFVQMLVMLLAAIIVVYMSLYHSGVGGISGLLAKLPASHIDGSSLGRPAVIVAWMAAMLLQAFLTLNDMSLGASKYLAVKDGASARRAALMAAAGFVFLPLLLTIPPLCSRVIFPHGLATMFPQGAKPDEAAFVAISLHTLPHGMLGLLVCGIFAAAIAGMDAALNRNAGIIVRNFYHPVIKPSASDRELLVLGKFVTGGCGVLVIGLALFLHYKKVGLFDTVMIASGLLYVPMVLPLFWGVFIRRTPSWAAWTTTLVAMLGAYLGQFVLPTAWFSYLLGWHTGLSGAESKQIQWVDSIFIGVTAGSIWFFATMRFAARSSSAYHADVDRFFTDMATPIDPVRDGLVYDDARQYRVMGVLCLAYGSAMALGAIFIPNARIGHLCFAFAAAVILGLGLLLWMIHRRKLRAAVAALPARRG